MHPKQAKFENPVRLFDLDPENTLRRIGLTREKAFCDIGAGSGIFATQAAKMTDGPVYAIDIDPDMLDIIREKADVEVLPNLKAQRVIDGVFPLLDQSVDLALMVTVFHEIDSKELFLNETERILKSNGHVAVIEFHKGDTPYGPPIPHRIAREDVLEQFQNAGFSVEAEFTLGETYYGIVFRKAL